MVDKQPIVELKTDILMPLPDLPELSPFLSQLPGIPSPEEETSRISHLALIAGPIIQYKPGHKTIGEILTPKVIKKLGLDFTISKEGNLPSMRSSRQVTIKALDQTNPHLEYNVVVSGDVVGEWRYNWNHSLIESGLKPIWALQYARDPNNFSPVEITHALTQEYLGVDEFSRNIWLQRYFDPKKLQVEYSDWRARASQTATPSLADALFTPSIRPARPSVDLAVSTDGRFLYLSTVKRHVWIDRQSGRLLESNQGYLDFFSREPRVWREGGVELVTREAKASAGDFMVRVMRGIFGENSGY